MSNIDKQALRDIAAAAVSTPLWHAVGIFGEVVDLAKPEWKPVHDFCKTFTAERVLDLLDELEAKDKQIAELGARLETADKLQDSAFRHGLQHGFSLGQTDNQAGFEECLSAYGTRGKDNG